MFSVVTRMKVHGWMDGKKFHKWHGNDNHIGKRERQTGGIQFYTFNIKQKKNGKSGPI